MQKNEEASYIEKLTNDPLWDKYIYSHLENRRQTLLRDIKSNREFRDENVGALKELDKFIDHIEQLKEDYKELKGENK